MCPVAARQGFLDGLLDRFTGRAGALLNTARVRFASGQPSLCIDILLGTVVRRLIHRFFDRDVIDDLFHAWNFLGEVGGAILLVFGIDEAAQLNRALERFHIYSAILILRVVCQPRLDAGRSAMVVDSFASALLVAIAGSAAGHAQEQWHRPEKKDRSEYSKGLACSY